MNKYEKAARVLMEPLKYSMVERTESMQLAIRTLEKIGKIKLFWRWFK